MANDTTTPLNYYAAYEQIKKVIPDDCIIVSEGANTMDTSRSIMNHKKPRHRLDAGTFGTMGVGSGFAIASAIYCREHEPNKRVLCIQGDSAFGFGGMELETAFRYKLPIVFIIFNNNGIYGGLDKETFDDIQNSGDPCIEYKFSFFFFIFKSYNI
jgi:2-hydroxyacyl-CoA lyase 1